MAVKNKISYLNLWQYIFKLNLKTAFLSKSDALVSVLMMLINNLAFAFMWWIIFNKQGSINGWQFSQMLLTLAIMNNAFAIYATLARGVLFLPEYISNGNLDNYINTPRNSLFMVSTAASCFSNWGDYPAAFIFYFMSGIVSWQTFAIFIFCSMTGAVLLYSFRLLVSCLAFWSRGTERLADNIFMAFITFAMQPASIFTGWYHVFFLNIIPAGLISYYPIELLKEFSWQTLFCLLLGVAGFFLLAIFAFSRGLRQYSAGSRFGIR